MVAYSFKKRFSEALSEGRKTWTLRNDRKRHARLGEYVQLYTGMRTRSCRLVGTALCIGVHRIRLDFEHGRVEFLETGRALTTIDELDGFAYRDGFEDWRDLEAFWAAEHEALTAWEGVMIQWGTLRAPQ